MNCSMLCSYCSQPLLSLEGTTLHLELRGNIEEFNLHSRYANDCVDKEIERRKKEFQAPATDLTPQLL